MMIAPWHRLSASGLFCTVSALALSLVSPTMAQETASQGTITVRGTDTATAPAPAYEGIDKLASGRAVLGQESIQQRQTGNGDAMELLKILPHVQFSDSQYSTAAEDIQSLLPSNISIAGGRYYDNYFSLDGVGTNNRMDVTQTNVESYDEIVGVSAQSLWVDPNLIGSITVEDSNISAEYGQFTGGVVDVKTKRPDSKFGATVSFGYSADELVNYKVSAADRENDGDDLPEKVDFTKYRWATTLNVPLSEKLRVLLGASRSESKVIYFREEDLGGGTAPRRSTSDNLMLKAETDLADDLLLTGQVTYTPYQSEYVALGAIDDRRITHGGGLATSLDLARDTGDESWSVKLSYVDSDMDRDGSSNVRLVWPSTASFASWCSSTNCTTGSFGDLTQSQKDMSATGKWSRNFGEWGTLRLGGAATRVEASRSRSEMVASYATTNAVRSSNVACADASDPACVSGEIALMRRTIYLPFDVDVGLNSYNAWAEHTFQFDRFEVRAGLRYDYETYLGNHDIAPRLSVVTELPFDTSLTVGANRYYSRSFLGYAIKEKIPLTETQRRTATTSNGRQVVSDNWTYLSTGTSTSTFTAANLDTPYSDELTAALGRSLLGGYVRLKGIYRQNKDEFARSTATESYIYTASTGQTVTRTRYTPTNDGESRYRGVSLEWTGDWRNHSLALNGAWSKRKTNNDSYLLASDESLADNDLVYYNGELLTEAGILATNAASDFTSPWVLNAAVTSKWWEDRITTVLQARWKSKVEVIADSGDNITVAGTSYDIWTKKIRKGYVDLGMNVAADVVKSDTGTLTVEARVTNLLDKLPHTTTTSSNPYQAGRSVWLGLNYRY